MVAQAQKENKKRTLKGQERILGILIVIYASFQFSLLI